MDDQEFRGERRRHLRFSLDLPVNVHVAGRPDPVTVEMIDIGAKAVRFRLAGIAARRVGVGAGTAPAVKISLDQQAAFGFVIPGQPVCVASGKVMRIAGPSMDPATDPFAQPSREHQAHDEFVLSIERANDAFHGFLVSLAH